MATNAHRHLQRERLRAWFIENGGHLNGSLNLTHDATSGQHFKAKLAISASEDSAQVLCRCPFSLTLSHLSIQPVSPGGIRNCSETSVCRHLVNKVPKAVQSYFFLCEQSNLGAESFWAPYVDVLPKGNEMTTPLWFEGDDFLWLLGTGIHISPEKSGVKMRRETWKAQWEEGRRVLSEAGVDTEQYTWSLFLWAATIFSSRSFTSRIVTSTASEGQEQESFALLYPVLDSFNHKFGAKVLWNMERGDFALSTVESTAAGQEVFNNYAPKGNEELLNGYGFCIEDNPCDEVALQIGQPSEPVHVRLREQCPQRFKSELWTDESATFFLRGSGHYSGGYNHGKTRERLRGIPPELLSTIQAILEYSYVQQGQQIEPRHLEPAAIDAILDRLIEKYNNIGQWNGKLPEQPANDKQKFASMYRDGQLLIMQEIIGELQEELDSF